QLRDPKLREYGEDRLRELAAQLKDPNIRIFAEGGLVHVFNSRMFLQGTDPLDLFPQMLAARDIHPAHAFNVPGVGRGGAKVAVPSKEMGLFHAFYLGYEMAKAVTALTLGKKYAQDQALHWGSLTVPEEPKGGPAAPKPPS